MAGELGPGRGRRFSVLPSHEATVRVPVSADPDLPRCGAPAQRDVGELAGDRAPGHALLASLRAPTVGIAGVTDSALGPCVIEFDPLADRGESEVIETAKHVEVGFGEGNLGHVEVFQMVSLGTSILWRP